MQFTAAQAAQKGTLLASMTKDEFTAAQAAQKNRSSVQAQVHLVHCRTGSSESAPTRSV